VQRALASLLLFLFAVWPAVGLLAAHRDDRLPACCRRDGKHRCAMMDAAPRTDAPGIASRVERCALFGVTMAIPGAGAGDRIALADSFDTSLGRGARIAVRPANAPEFLVAAILRERGPPSISC